MAGTAMARMCIRSEGMFQDVAVQDRRGASATHHPRRRTASITLRIRLDMPCGQASRGGSIDGPAANGARFASPRRCGPDPPGTGASLRGAAIVDGRSRGRQCARSCRAACCAGGMPASASMGSDSPSAKACGFIGVDPLEVTRGGDGERRPAHRRSPGIVRGCHAIPRPSAPPAGKCRDRRRPCPELGCVYGFRPGRTAQSMLRDTGSGHRGRDANMLHRTIAPSHADGLPDALARRAGRCLRPVGHVRADHRNEAPSP